MKLNKGNFRLKSIMCNNHVDAYKKYKHKMHSSILNTMSTISRPTSFTNYKSSLISTTHLQIHTVHTLAIQTDTFHEKSLFCTFATKKSWHFRRTYGLIFKKTVVLNVVLDIINCKLIFFENVRFGKGFLCHY
jgi:hypothetical protein